MHLRGSQVTGNDIHRAQYFINVWNRLGWLLGDEVAFALLCNLDEGVACHFLHTCIEQYVLVQKPCLPPNALSPSSKVREPTNDSRPYIPSCNSCINSNSL